MIPELKVSGDRQTGKTSLLMDVAVNDAFNGRRVLFVSPSLSEASSAFRSRFALWSTEDFRAVGICKHSVAYENKYVSHVSGGGIYFRSASGQACRGVDVDTLIFDGVDILIDAIPFVMKSKNPRIYKSECTENED